MKISLGELVGSKAASSGISLDNLKDFLGDKEPNITLDAVGKFRLTNALRERFGDGYRNIKGVPDLLDDFDQRVKHAKLKHQLSGIKPKGGK